MFHVPAHKAPLAGIPPAGQRYFDPRLALVRVSEPVYVQTNSPSIFRKRAA